MNKCIKLIIFISVFISTGASAETNLINNSGMYLQAGVAGLDLKIANRNTTYSLGTTATAYIGGNFNEYIGLELMGAYAVNAENTRNLSFSGVYVKPRVAIGDSVEAFIRIGENRLTAGSYYGSISISSISYGGGLNWYPTTDKKLYLQADYMVWGKDSTATLSGAGIGVGYRF